MVVRLPLSSYLLREGGKGGLDLLAFRSCAGEARRLSLQRALRQALRGRVSRAALLNKKEKQNRPRAP